MIKFACRFVLCFLGIVQVSLADELPGGRDRSELMNIVCHEGDNLRGLAVDCGNQKLFFVDYVNDNKGFRYHVTFGKISESNWTAGTTIYNRFPHYWSIDEKNVLTLADKNGINVAYERVEGGKWKIRCAGKYVKVSDETEKYQFDDDPKHTINVRRLILTEKEPSIFSILGGSK